MKAIIMFGVAILIMMFLWAILAHAEEIDDIKLLNAIWRAEGGDKAQYAYGIRSVRYKDQAEARQICLNTIRNQRKRHARHNCGLSYLECLAKRYAPIQAKNDPKGLNKNWLNNVRYFYNQKRGGGE